MKKKIVILTTILSLLPVVIKIGFGEWGKIPTSSMSPTLLAGDWIWYEKYSYGASLPRRLSEVPLLNLLCAFPNIWEKDLHRDWGYCRVGGFRQPKRMDVVIFRSPENEKLLLVKRIIGIPGDTLEIRNGKILINGKQVEEPDRWKDSLTDRAIRFPASRCKSWTTLNYGPLYIPQPSHKDSHKFYFVMGDSRNNSLDSRYIGYVPFENIVGKVCKVLYSPCSTKKGLNKIWQDIE